MKRLLFLGVTSALMFTMGGVGPAQADNGPHVKINLATSVTPDGCAGCHRIHSAKTDMLTIDVQPALCYTCHGTDGAGATTDVQNGVAYVANKADPLSPLRTAAKAGALRGGGFKNALIASGKPTGQRGTPTGTVQAVPALDTGVAVTSSHSVDSSSQTAWGQGEIGATGTLEVGNQIQLRCGSCHDPHGNGNYRILRPLPKDGTTSPQIGDGTQAAFPVFTGTIADAAGVPNTTAGDASRDYTTKNYWASADVNAPAYIANVSAWCSTCHTRYLATRERLTTTDQVTKPVTGVLDAADKSRADSGDGVFTYRHTSSEKTAGGKNCITCHVSHGSNAATGAFSSVLKNPGSAGTVPAGDTGTGDSRLLRIDNRGTCLMCHGM